MSDTIILGAGFTGLAAGWSSGFPIYEAASAPGGICASYYLRPGDRERLPAPPADGEAYRFEIGGGHWIFGGEPRVLEFLRELAPLARYQRRASVYFASEGRRVPFPLQDHLHALGTDVADAARAEMATPFAGSVATLRDWLLARFGPTLCERFFFPFHERYTAGLFTAIAPQDLYKSPTERPPSVPDYNQAFRYPEAGLDALARALAARCAIHYDKRAVKIDAARREVHFADGSQLRYERLLTTLPLSQMLELAGIALPERPDPSSGVLVLNLGAERGSRCPDDHWLYVPDARAGFHRMGCYSNVDPGFLPRSQRETGVALYVERALRAEPGPAVVAAYAADVVRELQSWGWIGTVLACDPVWIEVAYTWAWPGSGWRGAAIAALESRGIVPVGRYARWRFQGIAESVGDGLRAGSQAT